MPMRSSNKYRLFERDISGALSHCSNFCHNLTVARQLIAGMQVHNDLKTKNILLSSSFDVAKIGAHTTWPCHLLLRCESKCRQWRLSRLNSLLVRSQ